MFFVTSPVYPSLHSLVILYKRFSMTLTGEKVLKRLLIVGVFLVLLIAGGLLTTGLAQGNAGALPGVRIQTSNPEAATNIVTTNKGQWFIAFAALLVVGPLVTASVVIAGFFLLSSKGIKKAKESPNQGFSFSLRPSVPNSLGASIAKHPLISISVLLLLLALGAVTVAIAFGSAFAPR